MKHHSSWPRIILHADMDAFYASVEQRDDPSLRGKPVIVGGTSDRGVVSTASYEARPFGVHSAMPTVQARKLCPDAVFLPPDFKRYTEASKRVMAVFRDHSSLVEPLSLDEAFLDMTGAEGHFGTPGDMARKIKREVFGATGGLTVSVGASVTKYVAKVASDHEKPDGLTLVPEGRVRAFLRPLDVSCLWGVGPKTRERMERIGLYTIADVADAGEAYLERALGSLGQHLRRLALGIDDRPVVPARDAKSVGSEQTLSRDVSGEEEIRPHLRRSAQEIARRLRKGGLKARGIRVKLKTTHHKLLTRQSMLDGPTDSETELEGAGRELLPQFDLSMAYRLVGLAGFDLVPASEPVQESLFEEGKRERVRKLERTLDEIRERFGEDAVRRGSSKFEE